MNSSVEQISQICNKTIKETVEKNLCISCRICSEVCPPKCISFYNFQGEWLPGINKEACINCSLCYEVCPGHQINWNNTTEFTDIVKQLGKIKQIFCVQSKDKDILYQSTSGGFVTTTVKKLLADKIYDAAFLLNGYNYQEQMEMQCFEKKDDLRQTLKSRYLTVSFAGAVRYMQENPDKKVILVGTSCALLGVLNFIELRKLERKKYLLIGLFCDKTMHYGVYKYFNTYPDIENRLSELYFRDKKNGGWPGHMRLVLKKGEIINLASAERMNIKDYFIPERCLYCMDKLNINADIAAGDNYIPKHSDVKGKSSIIIRTEIGFNIFDAVKDAFIVEKDTAEDIVSSTAILERTCNLKYANIKGLKGFESYQPTLRDKIEYRNKLKKIKIGKNGTYGAIQKDIRIRKVKHTIRCILGKSVRILKKKIRVG